MKKKHIVIIAAALVLSAVIAFFVLRIYPPCNLCRKLAGAETIRFEGTFHLENGQDDDSGEGGEAADFSNENSSSLIELLQDGKIKGEYTDGTLHCFIYQEGMDTALLEIYHNENDDIINIRQMLEFGIDYLDGETLLPIRQIFNLIDTSAECYVTETQFKEITGASILPEFDGSEDQNLLLFTVLLKADRITENNGTYVVENSDHTIVPIDFSIEFTISGEKYPVEIPESSIDDDQIPTYRKIYEIIMGVLMGK